MPDISYSQLGARLAIAEARIDVNLHPVARLPTAVIWNRLEGRPRSDDLSRPMRSEVRDPAWMLGRQWQLGEFEGQDSGAPIRARLLAETLPLANEAGDAANAIGYDPNTPLEVSVERQPVEPDLIMGLHIGRKWLRMLVTTFGAAAAIIESFKLRYAITAPGAGDNSLADLQVKSNPSEFALCKALARRSLDGRILIADIRAAKNPPSPAAVFAARGVNITPDEEATINALATKLLSDFGLMFASTEADQSRWIPSRLEHNFSLRLTEAGPSETQLVADQFPGGRLDWYSFDVDRRAAPAGTPVPDPVKTKRTFVPMPVEFFGMPNVRWWEFEDHGVGFGITAASKTDLVKLLLAEFGLVFSNDWFLIPLNVDSGSLTEIAGIVVTDNFGLNTLVEPFAKRHQELGLKGNWGMWTLALRDKPNQVDQRFFLAPVINRSIDSAPVDEVLFLRDEMANVVWGVETAIPDPLGGGRDARFAGSLMSKAVQQTFPFALQDEVPGVPIRYQLMNSVPENWIPFVSVKAENDDTATLLLQGAMPRLPPIESQQPTDQSILENNVVLPRGTVLARDPVNKPNVILEEEILRDGILVRRRFRHTRWLKGRSFTWCALEKRTGRGEGSSGLAFDSVIEKPKKEG